MGHVFPPFGFFSVETEAAKMPEHFMEQIRQERLERDRREAEKARHRAEHEALPKQRQTMLLDHLDDLAGQQELFE